MYCYILHFIKVQKQCQLPYVLCSEYKMASARQTRDR